MHVTEPAHEVMAGHTGHVSWAALSKYRPLLQRVHCEVLALEQVTADKHPDTSGQAKQVSGDEPLPVDRYEPLAQVVQREFEAVVHVREEVQLTMAAQSGQVSALGDKTSFKYRPGVHTVH